ncbi:MAG: hypothetical protein SVP52_01630 [Chloroflexota bacterium]|nr:hypothetical protein [Chloroflexota bacterium]
MGNFSEVSKAGINPHPSRRWRDSPEPEGVPLYSYTFRCSASLQAGIRTAPLARGFRWIEIEIGPDTPASPV